MSGLATKEDSITKMLKDFGVSRTSGRGRGQRALVRKLYPAPSIENFTSLEEKFNDMQVRTEWQEVQGWAAYYAVCPLCQLDFTFIKIDGQRSVAGPFPFSQSSNI